MYTKEVITAIRKSLKTFILHVIEAQKEAQKNFYYENFALVLVKRLSRVAQIKDLLQRNFF